MRHKNKIDAATMAMQDHYNPSFSQRVASSWSSLWKAGVKPVKFVTPSISWPAPNAQPLVGRDIYLPFYVTLTLPLSWRVIGRSTKQECLENCGDDVSCLLLNAVCLLHRPGKQPIHDAAISVRWHSSPMHDSLPEELSSEDVQCFCRDTAKIRETLLHAQGVVPINNVAVEVSKCANRRSVSFRYNRRDKFGDVVVWEFHIPHAGGFLEVYLSRRAASAREGELARIKNSLRLGEQAVPPMVFNEKQLDFYRVEFPVGINLLLPANWRTTNCTLNLCKQNEELAPHNERPSLASRLESSTGNSPFHMDDYQRRTPSAVNPICINGVMLQQRPSTSSVQLLLSAVSGSGDPAALHLFHENASWSRYYQTANMSPKDLEALRLALEKKHQDLMTQLGFTLRDALSLKPDFLAGRKCLHLSYRRSGTGGDCLIDEYELAHKGTLRLILTRPAGNSARGCSSVLEIIKNSLNII